MYEPGPNLTTLLRGFVGLVLPNKRAELIIRQRLLLFVNVVFPREDGGEPKVGHLDCRLGGRWKLIG